MTVRPLPFRWDEPMLRGGQYNVERSHCQRCNSGHHLTLYAEPSHGSEPFNAQAADMLPFEKIVFLNQVPLFANLKTEDLQLIATIANEESYPAGERLFEEGDYGDRLFVVVTGNVEILKRSDDGSERAVTALGANSFLGEMALFDDSARSASAVCQEDSCFLVIDKEEMTDLIYRYPEIAIGVISGVSRRLRDML